jgi:hypothetical protein
MRAIVTARYVIIALSGVLIGLLLSGGAHAIVETTFRYTTPQTGYLMIPPAAFVPQDKTVTYSNLGDSLDTTGTGCFSAPVNLPNGAKMTQFGIWYAKDDATAGSSQLVRVTPADGSVSGVAYMEPAASARRFKGAAITVPSDQTVNNARYMYFAVQCQTDQTYFYGARIQYTYVAAGD